MQLVYMILQISMSARKGLIIATCTRNVPTISVLLSARATMDSRDPVTVAKVRFCLFCAHVSKLIKCFSPTILNAL